MENQILGQSFLSHTPHIKLGAQARFSQYCKCSLYALPLPAHSCRTLNFRILSCKGGKISGVAISVNVHKEMLH